MSQKILLVVSALIERNGKHLIAQRFENDHYGLFWEFPGGTVEKGETHKDALRREMEEELGVEVEVGDLVNIYEDETEELKIIVYIYGCEIIAGDIKPIECAAVDWVRMENLDRTILAPADRKFLDWYLLQIKYKI